MPEKRNVSFTKESLKRLKVAYKEAIDNNQDSFIFEENEYVVSYAKYLIEYLETQLT